jgi:hypothetical protein
VLAALYVRALRPKPWLYTLAADVDAANLFRGLDLAS